MHSLILGAILLGFSSPAHQAGSPARDTERPVPADVVSVERSGVTPLHRVGRILLAGQPAVSALEGLAAEGTSKVIDLRMPSEPHGYDEVGRARELGLEYANLGFGGEVPLTDALLDDARARLAQHRSGGTGDLLLHCASANRVGAVWVTSRVLDEGVPWARALEEAHRVGLRSAPLEESARLYVSGGGSRALGEFKEELRVKQRDVPRVTVPELIARLAEPRQVPLLLDARAASEFAVSHLPGAVHAETLAAALAALGSGPKEREVIVYCSVGVRSGALVRELARQGFTGARNLEGSIFEWANAGHPVFDDAGPVRRVHPFSKEWGRLLRRELWSELGED